MNLNDALTDIAARLKLDAEQLISLAAEDDLPGYNGDPSAFPIGSLWQVEGQILYALVRRLEPMCVLELGTHKGASAAHIAAALAANGRGRLYTVDIVDVVDAVVDGGLLPEDLYDYVTFVAGDALAYLDGLDEHPVDIIFEDMAHGREQVADVARLAHQFPGALVIHHDAEHYIVGADVRGGLDDAGVDYVSYLIEPSDCGLALWNVPKRKGKKRETA